MNILDIRQNVSTYKLTTPTWKKSYFPINGQRMCQIKKKFNYFIILSTQEVVDLKGQWSLSLSIKFFYWSEGVWIAVDFSTLFFCITDIHFDTCWYHGGKKQETLGIGINVNFLGTVMSSITCGFWGMSWE